MCGWIFLLREINGVLTRARGMGSIEFITTRCGRAGLCVEGTTDERGIKSIQNFTRDPLSVFWKALLRRKNWRRRARKMAWRPWRCWIAMEFTAHRVFITRQINFRFARTSERKLHPTGGWRYPLLVQSRAGYQNLCRLITLMKLRAAKGEGEVSAARSC